MLCSNRPLRRVLAPGLVAALVAAVVALLPAAPAAAAAGITVTPATNLTDGQSVTVSATGFPANTTVGIIQCGAGAQTSADCDLRFSTVTTDASGAFSGASFRVNQVINSGNLGILDCAADACIVAVGTFDLSVVVAQPITMVNTLGPPDGTISVSGPFIVDDAGHVSGSADITCNVTKDMLVHWRIRQGSVSTAGGVVFPCTTGATVHVFSDYLTGAFTPGSLDVNASIETGPYPVRATGTVTLQSTADATAALTEALNGPNGAQVLAQFVTDLQFRLAHNPMFTHAFYVAILQALRTG